MTFFIYSLHVAGPVQFVNQLYSNVLIVGNEIHIRSQNGNLIWFEPLPPKVNDHFFGLRDVKPQVIITPAHIVPNCTPVFLLTTIPDAAHNS